MSDRTAVVVALAAAGCLVAACTTTSAGEPHPRDGISTQSTSRPFRPQEIRLDGKDPCALIPEADRTRFYIERPGIPDQSKVYKSPECLYSTEVAAFNIILVVTEGIEKWTDGSKSAEAKEVAPVAGFPAIAATLPTIKFACDVVVDVASGQYLLASVMIDTGKDAQLPERCEYAHQLAESAMSTLVKAG